MGRAWTASSPAAKAVFDRADQLLGDRFGASLSTICCDGPGELLHRTDVSQPAIYTCSVASWHGMHGADAPLPAATAGLSLGEYTALHLAGVFTFEDGLHLVAERGRLMQAAAESSNGGMVAVMGLEDDAADALCADALNESGCNVLVAANFNAPGQIVLSGDAQACDAAVALCSDRGLRATALTVAGAFHSAHMQPAADGLEQVLGAVQCNAPQCEVWSNVTAGRHEADPESIRARLVEQLTSPVRWAQEMMAMVDAGHVDFTELAPGRVLRGLMRRVTRDAKVESHDEPDPTHVG